MSPTLFLTSCIHSIFLVVFVSHGGASSTSSRAPLVYWNSILPNTPIPVSVRHFLNTGVRNPFHINTSICADTTRKHIRYDNSFNTSRSVCTNKSNNDTNAADFLLEKDLQVQQSSMDLHFYRDAPMTGGFVPRSVANSIPISSQKLPDILRRFSVEPNSLTANMMKESIGDCETPAMVNEKRFCATSLESMVDFATSVLETTNVKAISTTVLNKKGSLKQRYSITSSAVKERTGSIRSVVCHSLEFPYAIFLCHMIPSTKVYSASLVGENGSKIEAIAVCHEDTSNWNPEDTPFKVLKVKPGDGSICHFLAEDSIIWTPTK